MGTTYCTNTDLVLDNGKSVDDLLDSSLSKSSKTSRKDSARERAYNFINDRFLRGRTLIPATHISALKQVEIDLVISDLMTGTFATENSSISDWTEKYKERAMEALQNLRFDASYEAASANSQNTGNGTVSGISVNNLFTKTEVWTLTALNSSQFSVRGGITGSLPNVEVDEAYPEKEWSSQGVADYGLVLSSRNYEEYPIYFTINDGAIDFVQYDRFTIRVYSASYFRQREGSIIRG